MATDSRNIILNIKKSFNTWMQSQLPDETINFDTDPFNTDDLDTWYSVRYTESTVESPGMGGFVNIVGTKGQIRKVTVNLGAWCRDDRQRAELSVMADRLQELSRTGSITLYDFTEPEAPVSEGNIHLISGPGIFVPSWGTRSGVWKTDNDLYRKLNIPGFILDIELVTVLEV